MTNMTTDAPTFGERLARARLWAGLSQEDMAERLDLHKRSIANYETGRRMPLTDVTVRWAAICGVPVELLLEPLVTTQSGGPNTRYGGLVPIPGQLSFDPHAERPGRRLYAKAA